MLTQIKRSLELYVPTCTQTKTQNRKHETTLYPCLDEALLFKSVKAREGEGNKTHDLARLGAYYT